MRNQDISDQYRSDHLFLLIGSNPLPNWVAARLLMKQDATAYLVHSTESIDVARRLAKKLLSQGYRQPEYVPVREASDASEIYRSVKTFVERIRAGRIGLNYTGGTKVMAVHSYLALERELPRGLVDPVFSYLDAHKLSLYFYGVNKPIFVGLDENVRLTLQELMGLHDEYVIAPLNREPIAWPVVEAVEKLHRTEAGYKAWRKWITSLQNKSPLASTTLEWPEEVSPVAIALSQGRSLTISLGDLCRDQVWSYSRINQPERLASWLEGEWIESYVLGILKANQKLYRLHDFCQDLNISKGAFHFQVDVAAIRGYQLHFFTCWGGNNRQTAKYKLSEAFTRARQMGGDEARAALVCMSEEPQAIESEVAQTMQIEGRVKVFGRRELEKLNQHLADWFKMDIPPEELQ